MSKISSFTKNKKMFGLITVVAFAFIGAALLVFTKAATATAVLSLTPATGSYDNGTSFTVGVYEDSGTQAVNSVSVGLAYDATKLDFVSVSTAGSPLATGGCPTQTGSAGKVSIVCFILPTSTPSSVTGKQLIANVTFRAKVGTGTTPITFLKESVENSAVFLAGTGENIWNGVTTGGTYTLTTPDTTGPVISWTAPSAGQVVNGSSVPVTAGITDDRGTVSSATLTVGTSTTPVTMTGTSSTYSYNWNTASVPDGSYVLTITAKDPAGNTTTATRTVQVLNNKPNLTVSSIATSPASPNTGSPVTLSAVVTNSGTAAIASGTAYVTTFSIGTTVISTITDTSGLAVGASKTITATPTWTAVQGTSTITVATDKTAVIAESNENDNTGTKTVVVYTLGDIDNNGTVTITDLNAVLNNWGKTGQTRTTGDLNGDGLVTITDLNQILNNWTK